jgi:hypothetical protein
MGADKVPKHSDLEELIAYLREELGHINQAILTLERVAIARAAYAEYTGHRPGAPHSSRNRAAKTRISHRLRTP